MILTNTPSILVTNQTISAVPGVAPPTWQANALIMGLIYGLIHVVGPDHLGTLMTLSAATTPQRAFKVGAAWGLGHSFGLVFVAGAIMTLHHFVQVDVETWEHYGDYVIGLSMVLCAAYFMCRESAFLVQQKDGTFVPQPCACHASTPTTHSRRRNRKDRRGDDGSSSDRSDSKKHSFCSSYNHSDSCSSAEEGCCESIPLVPREPQEVFEESSQQWNRDAKGAAIGMLQGFCCPLGMVGMTFLATLSAVGAVTFLFTFLIISAFGTASLAAAWACLTSRGIGTTVSPRAVYRTSCCFTMCLGILWIVANYCGFLDKLNYAEHIHAHAH